MHEPFYGKYISYVCNVYQASLRGGGSLVSDCIFRTCRKMGLVNCLFHFCSSVPAGEQSTSEMDVDRGTLAAGYRLGFSIFRNEH